MPRRFSRKQMHQSASEIGADDGIDPKEFFRKPGQRSPGRKSLQLCSQVQQALYWVLGSECGDESLALLEVLSVEPAPDSSRLLVTLMTPEEMTIEEALENLQLAGKAIRSEVASAIHRRKAPELVYRVIAKE
jgi:ribosome-binding factor A